MKTYISPGNYKLEGLGLSPDIHFKITLHTKSIEKKKKKKNKKRR